MIAPRTTLREALAGPPAVLALIVYLIASLVLFGKALPHSHQCICLGTDEGIFIWAFAWWPHALLHGSNPFHSEHHLRAAGVQHRAGRTRPGRRPALLSGDRDRRTAVLLQPRDAAVPGARRVLRVPALPPIDRQFWPSLVGGWLFGFSTYMFGQLMGHMQLTLVFLIPGDRASRAPRAGGRAQSWPAVRAPDTGARSCSSPSAPRCS